MDKNIPFVREDFVALNGQISQRPFQRYDVATHQQTDFPSLPIRDHPINIPLPVPKLKPPVNRMPVEILGEIFIQFLQMGEFVTVPDKCFVSASPNLFVSPVILGQVCGYWRSIALSMPSLWCSISVSSPIRGVAPRIQLWLERAAQSPLKLFITQSFKPDLLEQAVTDEVVSLLLGHYRHWKHITFKIFGGVLQSLVNMRDEPPPLLESADLDLWWRGNDRAKADKVWRILHSSPKLARVDWRSAYLYVRHLPTHIPWNQLRALALSHQFDTNGFCTLLEQCSQLERLEVQSIDQHCSLPAPSTPIILLHLRHLSIDTTTGLGAIFERLLTPALNLISLTYDLAQEESRGTYEFGNLLRRSSCSLKSFILRDLDGADFLDFLLHPGPQMDSLEWLHIQTNIPPEAVAALTLRSANEVQLLPHLQRLKLLSCSSSEGVAEMLSSRLQRHQGCSGVMEELRSVCVGIKADTIPCELAAFQSINREGIQIELCYNTVYL